MVDYTLIDALPYIDLGYLEPGVREAVLSMVEEETKIFKPTKNYLEHLPPLELHDFESTLLKNEMERIEKGLPMKMFPMRRYELPSPVAGSDVASWSEAVDNSFAQLEHQAIRIRNLNLMKKYGAEAYKNYNHILTSMLNKYKKELAVLKKQIEEINWRRKNSQTAAGEKLRRLENEWVSLVTKNYEIERALVDYED